MDQLPCSPVPLAGVDILCLGLGNPAVEASSLKQLALLDLLIEQEPRLNRAGARLYDPVFRRTARRLIEYLGMEASLLMVFCLSMV
ncbi:unnamed protein product [Protopolystoma xenopodis]|uniref:SRR1-like domain-containing protein n=1 Tax=Protopolystoma xenopodis TaxID=117903 RepID=A0A3S5ATS9_9PLAT|nr:unnamed protein product [Protopolystoma xenopodis]